MEVADDRRHAGDVYSSLERWEPEVSLMYEDRAEKLGVWTEYISAFVGTFAFLIGAAFGEDIGGKVRGAGLRQEGVEIERIETYMYV